MPTCQPTVEVKPLADVRLDTPWNVIVHNDPVNLMPYVVFVFQKVLSMTKEVAQQHMLEVHQKGRSVVWSGDREKAEYYMYQLQSWKLNATMEQAS